MEAHSPRDLETDPRFPSGKWAGYFLMPHTRNKRHPTEMCITFERGKMIGDGRDQVGDFVIDGEYAVDSGKCHWKKSYIGQHHVFYDGFNEGKGIWGVWSIPNDLGSPWQGGFHIWPEGMCEQTTDTLEAEVEAPVETELPADAKEPELVPS